MQSRTAKVLILLSCFFTILSAHPAGAANTTCNEVFGEAPALHDFYAKGLKVSVNTSNPIKMAHFTIALEGHELNFGTIDLTEIDADPIAVAVHKASQFYEDSSSVTIVEDTSLHVDGVNIGANVRWLIDELPKLKGRHALWEVALAYEYENKVYVFVGQLHGTIVQPSGIPTEPGFGPYFLPNGAHQTLSQLGYNPIWSARAKAAQLLKDGKATGIYEPILSWDGPWQH